MIKFRSIFCIMVLSVLLPVLIYGGEGKNYGQKLTLKEETKISTILENPEDYVGKKVLVKGRVVEVCKKRGCWVMLASDKEYETIQIKVNDGEIVFPVELIGKLILAEGVVEKLVIAPQDPNICPDDKAKVQAENADTSKNNKPTVIYRIKGLGAVVQE